MAPDRNVPESEVAQNVFNEMRLRIKELSDPEYQARVWLGEPPDEKSSYLDASAEIVDQDERYELIADHLAEIGLSRQQWAYIVEFSHTLKDFEDSIPHPYDDAEVMSEPGWDSIVRQARTLLAKLPNPD